MWQVMAGGLAGCITGAIASLAMVRRAEARGEARAARDRANVEARFRSLDEMLAEIIESNDRVLDEMLRAAVQADPLSDLSCELGPISFALGHGNAPEDMP